MTEQRALLPAVVAPAAAYVIARDLGDTIKAKGREMAANKRTAEIGRQLLVAAEQMRESGRQWWASTGAPSSGNGTSEQQSGSGAASSASVPPHGLWTSGQVAGELKVSDSLVRRWCRNTRLPATKTGGTWWIEPAAVAAFIEDRSRGHGFDR